MDIALIISKILLFAVVGGGSALCIRELVLALMGRPLTAQEAATAAPEGDEAEA